MRLHDKIENFLLEYAENYGVVIESYYDEKDGVECFTIIVSDTDYHELIIFSNESVEIKNLKTDEIDTEASAILEDLVYNLELE